MVSSSLGTDLLVSKDDSSTPRTVLLGVLGLHRAGVPGLQVNVRGSVLGSVLFPGHPRGRYSYLRKREKINIKLILSIGPEYPPITCL